MNCFEICLNKDCNILCDIMVTSKVLGNEDIVLMPLIFTIKMCQVFLAVNSEQTSTNTLMASEWTALTWSAIFSVPSWPQLEFKFWMPLLFTIRMCQVFLAVSSE